MANLVEKIRNSIKNLVMVSAAAVSLATTEIKADVPSFYAYSGNRTFAGNVVTPDIDRNCDLDFILGSQPEYENGKYYRIRIHEECDPSNKKNLDRARIWVNEASYNPDVELRVDGFYRPTLIANNFEEGILDPYAIIRVETIRDMLGERKYEEVIFTDKKDSIIYYETPHFDVNIIINTIYRPGHFVRYVHYPCGIRPWWDVDGDGIPNIFDPWPTRFGPFTDINRNGIIDWYDPFIERCNYWIHWNTKVQNPWFFSFWVSFYSQRHIERPRYYREYERIVIKENRDLFGRNNFLPIQKPVPKRVIERNITPERRMSISQGGIEKKLETPNSRIDERRKENYKPLPRPEESYKPKPIEHPRQVQPTQPLRPMPQPVPRQTRPENREPPKYNPQPTQHPKPQPMPIPQPVQRHAPPIIREQPKIFQQQRIEQPKPVEQQRRSLAPQIQSGQGQTEQQSLFQQQEKQQRR